LITNGIKAQFDESKVRALVWVRGLALSGNQTFYIDANGVASTGGSLGNRIDKGRFLNLRDSLDVGQRKMLKGSQLGNYDESEHQVLTSKDETRARADVLLGKASQYGLAKLLRTEAEAGGFKCEHAARAGLIQDEPRRFFLLCSGDGPVRYEFDVNELGAITSIRRVN
jgi:hypothetical protein